MHTVHEKTRRQMLELLDHTHQKTTELISHLDSDRVIHTDERSWRVRDILGHLGVWNMEAARSLQAFADGGEYSCVPSDEYYEYNGPSVDERKAWTMDQVWAEYNASHDKLKQIVASLPDEKWEGDLLYPWSSRGTVQYLVEVMMNHETVDHCQLIINALH